MEPADDISEVFSENKTLSLASVARYLSPDILDRLLIVESDLSKYVKEVKDDPIYWMKQLSMIENLTIDPNDRELQKISVNWKDLYERVKEYGVSQLLFENNPEVIQIGYNADYNNHNIITDAIINAIEHNNLESIQILTYGTGTSDDDNISEMLKVCMKNKSYEAFEIVLSSSEPSRYIILSSRNKIGAEYLDPKFFGMLLKKFDVETPEDIINLIYLNNDHENSTGILYDLVKHNNLSMIEYILKTALETLKNESDEELYEDSDISVIWHALLSESIILNRVRIIDLVISHKKIYGGNWISEILQGSIKWNNYTLTKKYINLYDADEEEAATYLKDAIFSRNSRTIQVVLDYIKQNEILIPDSNKYDILAKISYIRDINILKQVIENIPPSLPLLTDSTNTFFSDWKEGFHYLNSIILEMQKEN